MDKKQLLKTMEKLRKELYELTSHEGFSNKIVLKKSQELDMMLNEYEDLLKEE